MRISSLALLAASSLVLAACGGGGGGGGSSSGVSPANPTNSNASNAQPVNVAPATPTRTQAGVCRTDQTLAAPRNDNLRIDSVRYLQVVEQDAANANATIVSNKVLSLRVDVLANPGTLSPTRATALVFNPASGRCDTFNLSGPNTIPTQVDNTRLNDAFFVTIPANSVQPGMTITVVFDDNQGRSSAEAARLQRMVVPAIVTGVTETVRVIPLRFNGQTGVANPSSVKSILERTAGVASVNVQTEAPFTPRAFNSRGGFLVFQGPEGEFNANTLEQALNEVDDVCDQLNGAQSSARSSPKCLGVWPDNVRFTSGGLTSSGEIVGVAFVGGKTMMTQSLGGTDIPGIISPYAGTHWLAFRAVTVAHEYGHLLNLNHAACGVSGRTDSRLYSDGRLGNTGAGYDMARGFYFSATQRGANGGRQFGDIMSYCEKEWPSDRGYVLSASYRAGGASSRNAASREVASQRWLKITGFDGHWQVRAVYTAPSTLEATDMTMRLSSSSGQLEQSLMRPQISDLPLASANGPYYVELPTSAVESLSTLSWQLLSGAGQLLSTGVGELLTQP